MSGAGGPEGPQEPPEEPGEPGSSQPELPFGGAEQPELPVYGPERKPGPFDFEAQNIPSGEPEPPVTGEPGQSQPQASRFTRRGLVKNTLKYGAALGFIGLVADRLIAEHQRDERHKHKREHERQEAEDFAELVGFGLEDGWREATVWPGLAFIPNSVELFSTPTLNRDTVIPWPEDHLDDHLAVQRPFLVLPTAQANDHTETGPLQDVGLETLGFWMPGSDVLAYCDRGQNANQILLPTHSKAAIYYNSYKDGYQAIAGESVTLQPAVKRQGLIWRYLNVAVKFPAFQGISAETIYDVKVCGRSIWEKMADLSNDYYSDESDQDSIEIIGLPPPPPESHRG